VDVQDPEHEEVLEAIGAYVVGGLDGKETTRIRRHLERCEVCRRELSELDGIHELLEAAVLAVQPPPELEERVVAAVLRSAASQAELQSLPASPGSGSRPRPVVTRRMRASLSSLAAAAVVIALVAVAVNYQMRNPSSENAQIASAPSVPSPNPASAFRLVAAEQPTSAPSSPGSPSTSSAAPVATSTVHDIAGSQGQTQYNPSLPGGELTPRLLGATWECEITVWGLEPGQLYEVWFKGRKGIASGGSFRVESSGIKTIRISTGLRFNELDEIVISAEPDDGNPAPNGRAVLVTKIQRYP
jgi:anti-sigma factor RsiW